jgi:hypothetical protein
VGSRVFGVFKHPKAKMGISWQIVKEVIRLYGFVHAAFSSL